jgi:hypothetical protein
MEDCIGKQNRYNERNICGKLSKNAAVEAL